ncbi:MAG: GyrI-like domain-containing protein [Chloroflexi bacterium]|nr:GyrI-like domain-containing protein [Chloroflexota bacterium]
MADKIDLRKELKHLYAPSARHVAVVDVPRFQFAMLDGMIEPGRTPATSETYQEAIGALYGISFTLKFMSKLRKTDPVDYAVMALEGLWWSGSGEFDMSRPEGWKWTMMMLQPAHITAEMFQEAVRQAAKKRNSPSLSRLRLGSFTEGLCIQTMHIGPYSEEAATIERMQAFARENGYTLRGKHHEVYLSDPRRCQPEKLKTVLRHPVARVT